jgi:hypothetical protein
MYRTKVLTPESVKTLRVRYWDTRNDEPATGNPVRPFLVMADGTIGEQGDAQGRVLEISFDEMSHNVKQFTYSIMHLNADGSESQLNSSEYLTGFTTQDITKYEHSLNTSELYTHYSFTFPNSDMQLKVSGNYAIRIYEDGDTEKTVAIVRFAVVEPEVSIQAKIRPNTDIELNGRYQQLDVNVDFSGKLKNSRGEDYFIVVQQNGRIDNQAFAPKPTFMESQRLRYTNCKALIFEGGNEYRHFDIFSTYFAGAGVDRIVHDRNDYHAILFEDALRGEGAIFAGERVTDKCGTAYIHEFDVNGQRVVNAERTLYDIDTEAEYMWVHWTLKADQPWFDGAVYVGGDVFENSLGPRNRMLYDAERKCYWLNALVKQGGVDYQYWFVEKNPQQSAAGIPQIVTLRRTEGSHWQTENEYTIYVYYRPFGSRFEQLVGLQVVH